MSDRILRIAFAAFLFIGLLGGCSENVAVSAGCPSLCSDESGTLRDTTLLGAVVLDSSLFGYPRLGESRDLSMLDKGDTADVRVVTRFDTLPAIYPFPVTLADSLIRMVDSTTMLFVVDTLASAPTFPLTIDAFDVDTTANDTLPSTLIPLFRADRLIGSQTFQKGDFKDTVRLTLNNDKVFAKIKDTLNLRIGLRVSSSTGSARLKMIASSFSPRLRFRVSADTSVKPDTVFLTSLTPTDNEYIQATLAVYPVVVKGALPPPPPGTFVIGGIAGARAYLKFDLPSTLSDSVQVIRASLLLNQVPGRSTGRTNDTLTIFTHPILASPSVTDVTTALSFMGSPTAYGVDSVRFVPTGSGTKSIELVNLVRFWKAVGEKNTSRSIVLRPAEEGAVAGELSFTSIEGLAALRPRLRLTYVPRRGFGIP
ncbi:MAG: hypothetical protein V4550_13035 [Gemmatimonadota bacterium]